MKHQSIRNEKHPSARAITRRNRLSNPPHLIPKSLLQPASNLKSDSSRRIRAARVPRAMRRGPDNNGRSREYPRIDKRRAGSARLSDIQRRYGCLFLCARASRCRPRMALYFPLSRSARSTLRTISWPGPRAAPLGILDRIAFRRCSDVLPRPRARAPAADGLLGI